MPYGNIVANTFTYEPRTPGIYSRAGVTFDQPQNYYRIRGATKNQSGSSAAVTRVLEKDVTINGNVVRKGLIVTLSVQIPAVGGFTSTEVDTLTSDIDTFLTGTTVSRWLQGES